MKGFAWEQLFPDETISSFLSRQVISSGFSSNRIAELSLWGNDNLQVKTCFPSLIPWISENFNICPDELIEHHTSLNYFKPFLPESKFQQTFRAFSNGDTEFVHKWLGRTSNRINEGGCMFYCQECIKDDLHKFGVAYWHRRHQLYGVMSCPVHGISLHKTDVNRRCITLPPQQVFENISISDAQQKHFTEFSYWLLIQNEISLFDYETLTNCYRIALFNKELACKSLRIRQKALREDLKAFYTCELAHLRWRLLFTTNKTYPYPCQLFYNYHDCHFHPAKHLALMAYLFSTPESFLSKYHSANEEVAEHFNNNQESKSIVQISVDGQQILSLFRQGNSLRNIARKLNLSIAAVKSRVIAGGENIGRRASKIFGNERRAILRDLMLGSTAKEIAKKFNVSVASVEQILTQHPEVKASRKQMRFKSSLAKHRQRLKDMMKLAPSSTRNQLKNLLNASYLWLFKHDKKWLYKHLPKSKKSGDSK